MNDGETFHLMCCAEVADFAWSVKKLDPYAKFSIVHSLVKTFFGVIALPLRTTCLSEPSAESGRIAHLDLVQRRITVPTQHTIFAEIGTTTVLTSIRWKYIFLGLVIRVFLRPAIRVRATLQLQRFSASIQSQHLLQKELPPSELPRQDGEFLLL